ncbi:MAG: tRNA (adenosine(37)-N6)-dimethylallyltransferase MiaA [Actinobacteria bacterium]|nr:tRNA (adenosine(37)-N6)-dimethylallyltransferase MiaA [Actinomycetota bacterium]
MELIVIVGPTAVGKSKCALELAKTLDGEIVSADSMQVYKRLDIGTAKPTDFEQARVKHHLIDLFDLKEDFSVAIYQKMARAAIEAIYSKNKAPLLVGGSGLYMRAVIDKFSFPEGSLASDVRIELETRSKQVSPQLLYDELSRLDKTSAEKIHPHNIKRIIRALEVIYLTGRPFSEFQKNWKERESIYNLKMFGLFLERDKLYERINLRVDEMFKKGLLEETKRLVNEGYKDVLISKQVLGYTQILDYLDKKCSFDEMVNLIKQKTRNFAKRQMTWFEADPRIKWIDADKEKFVELMLEEIKNG